MVNTEIFEKRLKAPQSASREGPHGSRPAGRDGEEKKRLPQMKCRWAQRKGLARIRVRPSASHPRRNKPLPAQLRMADRAARLQRRAAAGGGLVQGSEDRDVLPPLGRLDEGGEVLEDCLGHVGQVGA